MEDSREGEAMGVSGVVCPLFSLLPILALKTTILIC